MTSSTQDAQDFSKLKLQLLGNQKNNLRENFYEFTESDYSGRKCCKTAGKT